MHSELDLAIIGMSGRFPGAANIEQFWRNLADGVESIQPLNADQLRAAGVSEETLADPNYVRAASRLEGVDLFDADFFGYSPREAAAIDPQQRLLLECAWEAMEDAGYPPSAAGGAVGVFAAASTSTYLLHNLHAAFDFRKFILSANNLQPVLGSGGDFPATRLSYKLNLTGPSLTIQTACSSSLVAVHVARQSLLSGECEMALAGGVSVYLPQDHGYLFQEGMILSPDGHCRVFDADAQGTVFGRGAGVVLLKPLAAAARDGDHIYAVIKGSAVNNDGSLKVGFTAPSVTGQAAVISEALANADVGPETIGYVEAHGTGTKQGDPMEIAGLTQAFRQGTQKTGYCAIGSLKANIGHLDAAAGIAGLIKTALVLDRGRVPSSLHFRSPNPEIDFASSPFFVNRSLRDWPRGKEPRRAGVSAFGMGGTNVHVILEDAPQEAPAATAEVDRPLHLLTMSARDEKALHELAAKYESRLSSSADGELPDICFTANTGRVPFRHRLAVSGRTSEELRRKLAEGTVWRGEVESADRLRPVFLFTGQGSQYAGMGRELYRSQPVFRQALDRCADLLAGELPAPLLEVMFSELPEDDRLRETRYTQPGLFALEYALCEMWKSWGVEPAAVMGHSVGEYAAACVAGVFSLPDALKLVAARGRLMQALPSGGAMAAVLAGEREVADCLTRDISVAALNGPRNTVISGPAGALEEALAALEKSGVRATRLAVSHSFHSARMEPMLREFEAIASTVEFRRPQKTLVSNLTGRVVDDVPDERYWRNHAREAVRFAAGIQTLVKNGLKTFVEIGPQPVLSGMGHQCAPNEGLRWIATLRRGGGEWEDVVRAVAELYVAGAEVNWHGFDRGYPRRRLSLPTYPFQRQRHWVDAGRPAAAAAEHPLLGRRLRSPKLTDTVFEASMSAQSPAYLAHHRVFGAPVLPATAYLEAVRAAFRQLAGCECVIEDMAIEDALVLPEQGARTVQLILTPIGGVSDAYTFEVHSLDGAQWRLHAAGRVLQHSPTLALPLPALQDAPWTPGAAFYDGLNHRGLDYGERFRGIARIRAAEGIAEAELQAAAADASHLMHPAVFDAGLQAVLACLPTTLLPVAFRRVRFHTSTGEIHSSRARVSREEAGIFADVQLLDASGGVAVEVERVSLRPVRRSAFGNPSLDELLCRPAWRPVPLGIEFSTDQLAASAARRLKELSDEHGLAEFESLGPKLDALCAGYVAAALKELGWGLASGDHELRVAPRHHRLLHRLLQMLEDGVRSLPPSAAGQLRRQYPSADAVLSMTSRCGADLAKVLRGDRDPLDLLFPGGSLRDLEAIYHRAPFARVYNGLVGQIIADAVAKLPAGRRLRVLEVGAGTGGTTASVLPVLPRDRTEYVYTDISPLFLARAEERFTEFPFVQYRLLDIDEEPEKQGFQLQSFDIVIASNVLHATSDLRQVMRRVHRMMSPGGLLVMVEGTGPQRWVDLIFGMTEGWWKFADTSLRPSYPLLSEAQWRRLLPEAGFTGVESPATVFEQAVILASAATARNRWLILGDSGGLGEELATRLRAAGCECLVLPAGAIDPDLNAVDWQGVVHLGSLDSGDFTDAAALTAAQEVGCRSVLNLVKALAGWQGADPPRLWLVTRGAQGGDNPAQAAVWGLGRVIALEHPELRCTRVDLASAAESDDAGRLLQELLQADDVREIVYRGEERCVPTLEPLPQEETSSTRRLVLARPGELESLAFEPCERRLPGPGELEIEVHACGVNFRDLLVALGMYPDADAPFGAECAGVVKALGPGVAGFGIGDEVLTVAASGFSSDVTAPAAMVFRKPALLTFEEAAGVPGVFLTAHYALRELAGLRAGETVLIHAAAGGVGLAAVQIARKVGAEVFATAGTEEKRRYLASIGVRHVMDSRSPGFAGEILSATGGRGVDVVLNSLSGALVEASVAVLAPAGRFVELGKLGVWTASRFYAARPEARYFEIDVAAECERQPEKMGRLMREVLAEFDSGSLAPTPRHVFDWKNAASAFRLMSRSGHIGKIVISQRASAGQALRFRGDASYLITGAFGGLGRLIAEWMVERGARHLVLLGHHAPSSAAQESIARMQAAGASVMVAEADVSREPEVAAVLARAAAEMPSLKGVIHAAGMLDDGVLVRQDWVRFQKVMAAKMHGALHLHRLTRDLPLDFFVLFSSAASLFGSPGQSNHAAANAFLDALAEFRRGLGLPALSINWGPWSDIGAAAQRDVERRMPIAGMSTITPKEGLLLLERLLLSGECRAGAFRMDWEKHGGRARPQARVAVSDVPQEASASVAESVREAPANQRRAMVARFVSERAANALGLDPSRPIDRGRPLQELGLDSLLAVELRNVLSNGLGMSRRLPATLLFDYPTIDTLAGYLMDALGFATKEPLRQDDGAAWMVEVEKLSEDEAERMLLQELTEGGK